MLTLWEINGHLICNNAGTALIQCESCPCVGYECDQCIGNDAPRILMARFSGVVSRGSACGDALAAFLNNTDIELAQIVPADPSSRAACYYCWAGNIGECLAGGTIETWCVDHFNITSTSGLVSVRVAIANALYPTRTISLTTGQQTENGNWNPSFFYGGDNPDVPMDCLHLDVTKLWTGDQQTMVVDYSGSSVRLWAP
jgi:hypothetical protein